MGTDCAPYLANFFLYSYEFDFLNDTLKHKDFATLYKFNKCSRYIDDLVASPINNDKLMDDYKTRIYPPELELNCEDKNDQEVTYLDLHLQIKENFLEYKSYDKRDNFGGGEEFGGFEAFSTGAAPESLNFTVQSLCS